MTGFSFAVLPPGFYSLALQSYHDPRLSINAR
jgi:hypothetical protein